MEDLDSSYGLEQFSDPFDRRVTLRRHGEYEAYSLGRSRRRGEGVLKHGKAFNEEMFELNEELYEVKISCMYDLSMPRVLMSIALRTRGECVAYSSSIVGEGGKGSSSQIWQRFQEELNEELCEVKISCAEPFVNGMSPEVHCIEKHGEYMAYSSGRSGKRF